MKNQIIDINRTDVPPMVAFHFKNSLKPFILVKNEVEDSIFVNLTENTCFEWENLPFYDLEFYTKENDEDFCGVELFSKLKIF